MIKIQSQQQTLMDQDSNTTPPGQIDEENPHNKLFLIKSKHAFKNYKNHDYFECRRDQSYSMHHPKNRYFVETPTPYGINNAFRYICTEASKIILQKSKNRKYYKQQQTKVEIEKENPRETIDHGVKPKSTYFLPNLSSESRKMEHHCSMQAQSTTKTLFFPKTEDNVTFIFYDKEQPQQKIGSFTLRFNIMPYVLNTFLKTKINYQDVNEQQYAYLKSMILRIYSLQKEYVQYKDMVNLRSIKQIFLHLQSGHEPAYKQQMIRYFFIANSTAYEYQMNKIKDQIKRMIQYQFNKDISPYELFIYDVQSGQETKDLFHLMKGSGKFVFGIDPDIIALYTRQTKQKEAMEKMASRIKKWKNVAPKQQLQSEKIRSLSSDNYHRLFDTVQKKRKAISIRRKPASSQKPQQFIDREKLYKDSSIFQ